MVHVGQRAVVIGAGVGGLSAAAALSTHFDEVMVVDRDMLPMEPGSRAGVPQDRHPHGILAGGLQALETLLPGYRDALADAGAVSVNLFRDFRFERPDIGSMPQRDCGVTILSASRPLIEVVLRRKVMAISNIDFRSGCRALEIVGSGARPAVRLQERAGVPTLTPADLVIDAGGRGTLTLALLDELGWTKPAETIVGVDISYTSVVLPWAPDEARNWQMAFTDADPPDLPCAAFLLPVEQGCCYLALAEHHAPSRPRNWADLLGTLRRLRTTTIYDTVCNLCPIGDLRHFLLEESRWRHFESLPKLLPGVLPLADSLCRFNPIYGQGMSVAAREAKLLRDVLGQVEGEADPIAALQARFMSNVGALLQFPWAIGVNADFAYRGTRGTLPDGYAEAVAFEAALFRAAAADPIVHRAFSNAMQLLEPFEVLQSPDIKRRIDAHIAATGQGLHAA